jgi:hypothetical protein
MKQRMVLVSVGNSDPWFLACLWTIELGDDDSPACDAMKHQMCLVHDEHTDSKTPFFLAIDSSVDACYIYTICFHTWMLAYAGLSRPYRTNICQQSSGFVWLGYILAVCILNAPISVVYILLVACEMCLLAAMVLTSAGSRHRRICKHHDTYVCLQQMRHCNHQARRSYSKAKNEDEDCSRRTVWNSVFPDHRRREAWKGVLLFTTATHIHTHTCIPAYDMYQ